MVNQLKGKEINFYSVYNTKTQDEKSNQAKTGIKAVSIIIPVFLVIALAGVYLYLKKEIKTYNDNALIKQKYIEIQQSTINDINQEVNINIVLQDYISTVDKALVAVESVTEIDEEILQSIIESASDKVSVSNFSYASGILSFSCTAINYKEAPAFVQRLRKTGYFVDINYTGFSEDVEGAALFDITATLNYW